MRGPLARPPARAHPKSPLTSRQLKIPHPDTGAQVAQFLPLATRSQMGSPPRCPPQITDRYHMPCSWPHCRGRQTWSTLDLIGPVEQEAASCSLRGGEAVLLGRMGRLCLGAGELCWPTPRVLMPAVWTRCFIPPCRTEPGRLTLGLAMRDGTVALGSWPWC